MMKKLVSVFLAIMLLFSLAACGQTTTNESKVESTPTNESVQPSTEAPDESKAPDSSEAPEVPVDGGKTLIVYFS